MSGENPSISSCAGEEVPLVEWGCLTNRVLDLDDRPSLLFSATLVMPDGKRKEVKVYLSPSPRHEALVLMEIDSVVGVPKVYGVTKSDPETLVLAHINGFTLDVWLAKGNTTICITVLLHVCKIVSRMHSLGVSYGNLDTSNIIVNVKDTGNIEVSLLGFHLAKRVAEEEDIRADERQMFSLAKEVVHNINEDSFNIIRDQLRHVFEDVVGELTLVEIVVLLCGFLNNHPTVLIPPYSPNS